eukprot:COSAG06_NODE_60375_length_271_cov_0.598837_1_plen_22_part_01
MLTTLLCVPLHWTLDTVHCALG